MALSNQWKEKALKIFPEIREDLEEADTPYNLWSELFFIFEKAYESPKNESVIKRVYSYADWCFAQPRGETAEDDLATCTVVSFYERIPTNAKSMKDMPRWFSKSEVIYMKQIFSYFLDGEEDFQRILESYDNDSSGKSLKSEL